LQAIDVHLAGGRAAVRLRLSDFNRLRWTVAALQLNPGLAQRLVTLGPAPAVLDSTGLLDTSTPLPPPTAGIVLWDGLNSLAELQQARPALRERADLRYLYVGSFDDVKGGFPAGSEPLFPRQPPPGQPAAAVRAPAWVGALAAVRARARPLRNARRSPAAHAQLRAGGCLVFCGLVRPSAAVLDGFFRGADLQPLRQALQPLAGLDWPADAARTRGLVAGAYAAATTVQATSALDHAALYSVLNVLHRIATLGRVQTLGAPLMVNEYGVHPFLDPYDAHAYHRNLFIDFGSTRGSDLLYPRTVDLLLQRKASRNLRFLQTGMRLGKFLAATDATAFLALCDAHAEQLVQALPEALRSGGRP
jgi:hypothetical protein